MLPPFLITHQSLGKKVILTGHSLGGSLALLLALDITVNHIEEVDGIDRETEVEQTNIKEKNNKEKSTMGRGDNHTKSKGKKEVVVERVGKVTTDTKSEQDELRDDYDSRKCGSYSHHRGRRCTGFAHPSILDNLSVMTFGQPELADLTFFESVSARSSATESLLNERYHS